MAPIREKRKGERKDHVLSEASSPFQREEEKVGDSGVFRNGPFFIFLVLYLSFPFRFCTFGSIETYLILRKSFPSTS